MPGRAPTSRLAPWRLDPTECAADLAAFERLLTAKMEVSERDDILPFVRRHPHLAAFLGTYAHTANRADRLGMEVGLFGQFVADVVAGNHSKKAYCLVEFEDGRSNSIFVRRDRHTTDWSSRFEHGISQIIDWMWLLDDQEHTLAFEEMFGSRPVDLTLLLVAGRDSGVSAADRRRLEWRSRFVPVNSVSTSTPLTISCATCAGAWRTSRLGRHDRLSQRTFWTRPHNTYIGWLLLQEREQMETSSRDTEEGLFPDEEWFAIQLAVVGSPAPVIAAVVPDLQAELEQRNYLRTRRVAWDPDTQRAIVDVEDLGYDPQSTAEGMAEELFEIAVAVLGDFKTFHIDIVSVRRQAVDANASDGT